MAFFLNAGEIKVTLLKIQSRHLSGSQPWERGSNSRLSRHTPSAGHQCLCANGEDIDHLAGRPLPLFVHIVHTFSGLVLRICHMSTPNICCRSHCGTRTSLRNVYNIPAEIRFFTWSFLLYLSFSLSYHMLVGSCRNHANWFSWWPSVYLPSKSDW